MADELTMSISLPYGLDATAIARTRDRVDVSEPPRFSRRISRRDPYVMAETTLTVNGQAYTVPVDSADESVMLLWVLREDLGLTGTKFGCGLAECGACTVHYDGEPIRACITPIGRVLDGDITTVEGLAAEDGTLHPVQEAWVELGVPQCGYCQSGQVMEAVAFLNSNPDPTDDEIREAMAGHLCRCGTYTRIFNAVKLAATKA